MLLAAVVVFNLVAAPEVAGDPRLATSALLIEELEYEQARELLLEVLTDPALTDGDRFIANMQAGRVQRILNRDVEARLHFREALKLDPDAALPEGEAPKIQTFFELVKREFLEAQRDAEKAAPPDDEKPAVLPEQESSGMKWPLLISGGVVAGLAVVVGAGAVAGATGAYVVVVVPQSDKDTRNAGRIATFAGIGVAVAAAAMGVVGGGTAVAGALLE